MLSLNLLVAYANLVFRIMLKFFKILEGESATKGSHTELKYANQEQQVVPIKDMNIIIPFIVPIKGLICDLIYTKSGNSHFSECSGD